MKPYILIIGNQEFVVNVVANALDRIIFNHPLAITYPKPKEILLNTPKWLWCTPDRDFTIEKSKITMILAPTNNLKASYIQIVNDLNESAKKAQAEAEKSEDAPAEEPKKEDKK